MVFALDDGAIGTRGDRETSNTGLLMGQDVHLSILTRTAHGPRKSLVPRPPLGITQVVSIDHVNETIDAWKGHCPRP